MIFYFLIFYVLTLVVLFSDFVNLTPKFIKFFNYITIIFFIFIIGFRDHTGGDWGRYKNYFDSSVYDTFNLIKIFKPQHDYGFELLSFIFNQLNLNFYFLVFFLSVIFVLSISLVAKNNLRYYSLTYLVAFPVIILVLGMGYLRQGIAVAFIIFAFNSLVNRKNIFTFIYLILAASFHKSALIILPIIILYNISIKYLFILIIFLIIIYFTIYTDLFRLWDLYVGRFKHLDSSGALLRYLYYLIPAIIFIFYRDQLSNNLAEKKLLLIISIIIILFLPIVLKASTFADRLLLYLSIIQLIVFPRIHRVLKNNHFYKIRLKLIQMFIIVVYFFYLYTWLNYSTNSQIWIPYNFYTL